MPIPCFSIHPRGRHDRLSLNPHTTREIRLRKHANLVEFLASRAINESMISGKEFQARMFACNSFSEIMRIQTPQSRAGAPRRTEQSARCRCDQRAKKKSVIDGRASSEGVNTPTGGDARPAMMRINKRAASENEQKTENRKQKTENRMQNAECRMQNAESKKQKPHRNFSAFAKTIL